MMSSEHDPSSQERGLHRRDAAHHDASINGGGHSQQRCMHRRRCYSKTMTKHLLRTTTPSMRKLFLAILALASLSASGVLRTALQWKFYGTLDLDCSRSLQEQSTTTEAGTPGNQPAAPQSLGATSTDDDQLLVFIGYLSAPGNTKKRSWLRKSCFQRIRTACLRINSASANNTVAGSVSEWGEACDGGFFIGQPSDPSASSSRQGKRLNVHGTNVEIEQAKSLQKEVDEFHDIHMLPMRDTYTELPSKTYSLLRQGAESGARVVLKIDDDHCPDMKKILSIAQKTSHEEARYIGYVISANRSLELERGPDGSDAPPYMNGPAYLVSRALARAVAIDNGAHSVLYMPYGSSTEDANMGKWYEHAKQTHPHLKFTREMAHPLASEHGRPPTKTEVSCGGHVTPTCAECPQGHGESWCHGHCVWSKKTGTCVLRRGLTLEGCERGWLENRTQPVCVD